MMAHTFRGMPCLPLSSMVFFGFGEELLFRGYIQFRLNYAFGKPFKFMDVNYGWGILITSALFGFMHVVNVGSLVGGRLVLSFDQNLNLNIYE